jgi:hypothetical protein
MGLWWTDVRWERMDRRLRRWSRLGIMGRIRGMFVEEKRVLWVVVKLAFTRGERSRV